MTLKEKMIYFNNSTRVFFCLDPIKNRKMNNASRVVYADDEEMHHSLLAIPPTFLTQRRELSVWNLQRGGSGITPSSRNVHERARSGGVETPPAATGYISFLERIFSDRSCNRHELFVWKTDKQWKFITRTKGLIPNNCM